tara:strand:- start:2347 stop:3273 length:927 start_codon:yes stop_codon:yes gene_type:complete
MKKKLYFLLLTITFLYTSTISSNGNKNNIIVKIGNEIITEFEIKNKILTTLFLAKEPVTQKNIDDLKKQSFELLIQNRLKRIELSKFDYVIKERQVNNYLKTITNLNSLNLKSEFVKNNLDYEMFIAEAQTDLKWQKLIYNTYSNKIKINEEKIEKEIQEIKKKSLYKEYKLSEIEILSTDKFNDNKKLSEIKENILLEGFENTALRFSVSSSSLEKGDIGWFSSKQLSKRIFDKIKNLKIGDITEPISNQTSLIILKLQDKREILSNTINVGELKQNLINKKKNELFNLYSRSYLSKLKNRTFIQYK